MGYIGNWINNELGWHKTMNIFLISYAKDMRRKLWCQTLLGYVCIVNMAKGQASRIYSVN